MTTHASRRFAPLLLLIIAISGCATRSADRLARDAELRQDYDLAVVVYNRAVNEDPDDVDARLGLERSRLRAAMEHFMRGRRFEAASRLDDARAELQIAAEMNPSDPNIAALLSSVQAQLRTRVAVAREGKTQLETLIERSRTLQPAGGSIYLPTSGCQHR